MNDPVYGFINVYSDLAFDLIEHPYFQRLRRIKQLGMTNFVYPAANHSRFQHALGAYHLMCLAVEVLRSKGFEITDEEAEAVNIAILLHDIGHGPFSHALEHALISSISHEDISLMLMHELNKQFDGKLDCAIQIFCDQYPKHFLHQLVSGQLDMDRLDYLNRDSFFTGVHEGIIGSDRIIKMLSIVDDQLVVEAKGIYSIEKFLIARRLMYWQVYLHKTVLSAEKLLVNILERASELTLSGDSVFATPSFGWFLYRKIGREVFTESNHPLRVEMLKHFIRLDDSDITACIKVWAEHPDKVLSALCRNFMQRKLLKIEMQKEPFTKQTISSLLDQAARLMGITHDEARYFVFSDMVTNLAYRPDDQNNIKILYNDGSLKDIAEASDLLNLSSLSATVTKYFLCYPKEIARLKNDTRR
jgi:HD superfamily phosphohydrolase